MHDDRSHPLLAQTPLSVNPFIDLPKPPTLSHNYASLPSTLPPSSIHVAPAPSNLELPAYVTSSSGFAAHPSTIIAQNKGLLAQLEKQAEDGESKVQAWGEAISQRDLAEKRRKAPGWLDGEVRILEPEKVVLATGKAEEQVNLMDQVPVSEVEGKRRQGDKVGEDLGAAMDRAFGRSEMG